LQTWQLDNFSTFILSNFQTKSIMDSSRRNFLKGIGAAAAGTAFGLIGCGGKNNSAADNFISGNPDKSPVIICRSPDKFPSEKPPVKKNAREILEKALAEFKIPLSAMFSSSDKIALKINCLSGRSMSTRPELVQAFTELLIDSGVKPDNITVWDRTDRDLTGAGYVINRGKGVKFIGADSYGYTSELIAHRSIGSFFAKILQDTDKIISLPVLKDHGIVGVTLGMKNFFGGIHNPNKYHLNAGNPYVADLYSHPWIKDKVKLTIVDGIVGQFEGGPPPMPQWQWNFGGVIVGRDPVAVDRIGLDIIEQKRAENSIMSLSEASRYPEYLKTAETLGLGNFDRQKIELTETNI
jgi:uncharacterized protein (DUF362 family)